MNNSNQTLGSRLSHGSATAVVSAYSTQPLYSQREKVQKGVPNAKQ